MPQEYLEIRGARVHNLKNISLRLPHNQMIVVTGVSGSGKSSLVFDIVYAEGRRRYVESLSSYARQFLERMERPDADEILGIAPTVAIRQKNTTRNPRSTVATTTEIIDFLRLLFARAGQTHCTQCGRRVVSDGVDQVTREILSLEHGSRWYTLFPALQAPGTSQTGQSDTDGPTPVRERLSQLRELGYNRLFQDGQVFEFSNPESLLDLDFARPVYILADRISISQDMGERVADAVEIAYRESGEIHFERAGHPEDHLRFSRKFECRDCRIAFPRPDPRLFSLNSYEGRCPQCLGTGRTLGYSTDLMVNAPYRSLQDGAIKAWQGAYRPYKRRMLEAAKREGIPIDVPYKDLSADQRAFIESGGRGFGGLKGFVDALCKKRYKPQVAAMLAKWREEIDCVSCGGRRYSQQALNTRVAGKAIDQVLRLPLNRALRFFDEIELERSEAEIAEKLLDEVKNRLRFLCDVGLGYLTLDRPSQTLSGGEAQRIQLASSLGSRLVGVCYVLDEPSIGLHSRDTARLVHVLHQLRNLGNTIFVVEHDREIMRAADYLVDLGPGGGERGGSVIFTGTYEEITCRSNGSLTGRYLGGHTKIPVPTKRRKQRRGESIRFFGAQEHNLKEIDFEIPLGLLTAVTGVSGSGKSTLLNEVVDRATWPGAYASIGTEIHRPRGFMVDAPTIVKCRRIEGQAALSSAVLVDQSAAEFGYRTVPVTYLGAFDEVRSLFSRTAQACQNTYAPAHFSFNVDSGRCETCKGSGRQSIDMQFLADVDLTCEDCNGKRFQPEILEITYREKNIWDVLQLTIEDAQEFFADSPSITKRLRTMTEVGLGYLRLGQPASQLSGGEAQRMKLAQYIANSTTNRRLFMFDEPTTGLHFEDIKKLLATFERLLAEGATVLVVEHNLDLIKCADWVIDLGPDGGDAGGEVVACGTPETIGSCDRSHTGRFLREVLA